jgi:hypothetical protein
MPTWRFQALTVQSLPEVVVIPMMDVVKIGDVAIV